jgi:hypothetical protein
MSKTSIITKPQIIVLAACMALGLSTKADNLLLNGSFELPLIQSNVVSTTVPASWIGSNVFIVNGDYSALYPRPKDGRQYAGLAHASALLQSVTINLSGTYILSWFDSSEYNGPGLLSPYTVIVSNCVGGVISSTDFDANPTAFRLWTPHQISMVLVPGTYTICFAGRTEIFAETSQIDNVALLVDNTDLLAGIHASAVDICWNGRSNQMYKVQFKTDISATNWSDLTGPILGVGANCVTDGIVPDGNRFYQVVRVP